MNKLKSSNEIKKNSNMKHCRLSLLINSIEFHFSGSIKTPFRMKIKKKYPENITSRRASKRYLSIFLKDCHRGIVIMLVEMLRVVSFRLSKISEKYFSFCGDFFLEAIYVCEM